MRQSLKNLRIRMKLTIKTMGPYAKKLGFKKMEIELDKGSCVSDLIERLSEIIKPISAVVLTNTGELKKAQKFLINGHDVFLLKGLDTILCNGDVIAIFPAVFGGSIY